VLLPLAACGGGGGTPVEPGIVEVKDNFFSPKTINVHTGDTVTWRWVGSVDHNVQGANIQSPTQGKGTTFTHTFDKAGDVDYVCTLHTGMTGKVRVTDN
jgi:plastocyanin